MLNDNSPGVIYLADTWEDPTNLFRFPITVPRDRCAVWASVVIGWLYPSAHFARYHPNRELCRQLALDYSE